MTLEFELNDILEEFKTDKDGTIVNGEQLIGDNIRYILRREKLWKKNYMMHFGDTTIDIGDTEDDPNSYSYEFLIFDEEGVVAKGCALGNLMVFGRTKQKEYIEVVDMKLELNPTDERFLEKGLEKVRVIYT